MRDIGTVSEDVQKLKNKLEDKLEDIERKLKGLEISIGVVNTKIDKNTDLILNHRKESE